MSIVKLLALSLATLSLSAQAFTFKEKSKLPKTPANIELDSSNTVVLRGPVDETSVSKVIRGIESSNEDIVYLYLDTPGGSVFAGMQLVSYIRASPKKIVAVVNTAISMGFVILQACDERLGTESSLGMQHETSYGIRAQSAPNAVSFQKFLERSTQLMDQGQAKRIGLSYSEFKAKIRSDWWTYGQDTVDSGVVDRLASFTCTKKTMNSTIEEVIQTPFGSLIVTWSGCPLLSSPLKVDSTRFVGGPQREYDFVKSLEVKTTALKDFQE